jgi:NADPH:quinone reductase-like Zn-dependent oxidoreductase
MKAILYHSYAPPDVLKIEEVEKPIVGENDVLVKVKAVAVNPYDWHFMRGKPYVMRLMTGLFKPKNPKFGADYSGIVEAVGAKVAIFRPGDEVYGCKHGAFAEFVITSEKGLALKPKNLSIEEAAAVPMAALTALQALRDPGGIKSGQKVLVNGASGGVGTYGVQIAKSYGCEVTGVCSGKNAEMVRSIGADHVIDYTKVDFARTGDKYDLILDTIGNRSIFDFKRALTETGTYVGVGAGPGNWVGPVIGFVVVRVVGWFGRQHLTGMMARITRQDLVHIAKLIESGKLKPIIERRYSFEQIPEAITHLETGRVAGKLVITVS